MDTWDTSTRLDALSAALLESAYTIRSMPTYYNDNIQLSYNLYNYYLISEHGSTTRHTYTRYKYTADFRWSINTKSRKRPGLSAYQLGLTYTEPATRLN